MNASLQLARIPAELRALPQWVVWRYEQRDGKETKVPYQPLAGQMRLASTTAPETWGSYEDVTSVEWADGIGFVFTRDDPFAGIDLDDCRADDGTLTAQAAQWVLRLDSYTEWSVSHTGVHVIVRGSIPGDRCRTGSVEMYDEARFFCMTGDLVVGQRVTIEQRQDALAELYTDVFPPKTPPTPASNGTPLLDDHDVLKRAMRDARFADLWHGRWEADYTSQSEAELALCSHRGLGAGADAGRVDNLFRQSGLMREKWERADYREPTLEKALQGDVYQPSNGMIHTQPASAQGDAFTPQLVDWPAVIAAGIPKLEYVSEPYLPRRRRVWAVGTRLVVDSDDGRNIARRSRRWPSSRGGRISMLSVTRTATRFATSSIPPVRSTGRSSASSTPYTASSATG